MYGAYPSYSRLIRPTIGISTRFRTARRCASPAMRTATAPPSCAARASAAMTCGSSSAEPFQACTDTISPPRRPSRRLMVRRLSQRTVRVRPHDTPSTAHRCSARSARATTRAAGIASATLRSKRRANPSSPNIPPAQATVGGTPASTAGPASAASRSAPRSAIARNGSNRIATGANPASTARSISPAYVARATSRIEGRPKKSQAARSSSACGVPSSSASHQRGQRFARQPERAAFVAEQIAPAAGTPRDAGRAAVNERAGTCDDDDAGLAVERTGVRDRASCEQREPLRRQSGRYAAYASRVTADAGDDRAVARRLGQSRVAPRRVERARERVAQPARIGSGSHFIRWAGAAASDDASALVADHGLGRTLTAVDSRDVRAHRAARHSSRA